MRLILTAAAALAWLSASQAAAQHDQTVHQPAPVEHATPTHEMCKAVMGNEMKPKQPHDHGKDKTGVPAWPNGKPLTDAEMKTMHERCAAKMSGQEGHRPK